MTFRWRLTLALVGLAVLCLAAAALAYRLWPLEAEREDFRPAPTLFAPPAAAASLAERL